MVKESASMEITRIAKAYSAKGEKVYTFSIGDTHFGLPTGIRNRLKQAIETDKTHYLDSQGIVQLRESISEFEYKGEFNASEILVVPGVKQGLFYFMQAFEGKRICILEPAWLGYHSICSMTGKEALPVNLKNENWLEHIKQLGFDALILCSPNNPDGKVFTKEELEIISQLCANNNAILVIDEIYAEYTFEESERQFLRPYYSQSNVVVMNGFSKAYAATGLRLGYVATHDSFLLKRMNAIHQNIATCAGSIIQYAFVDYRESIQEVRSYADYYKQNRDLVCSMIPEFIPFKPGGGFYFFVDLNHFSINNSEKFCKDILADKRIALVPGTAYGTGFSSWIRLSYSCDRQELEQGINLLNHYLKVYEPA